MSNRLRRAEQLSIVLGFAETVSDLYNNMPKDSIDIDRLKSIASAINDINHIADMCESGVVNG